jgi:hypothetical protein
MKLGKGKKNVTTGDCLIEVTAPINNFKNTKHCCYKYASLLYVNGYKCEQYFSIRSILLFFFFK